MPRGEDILLRVHIEMERREMLRGGGTSWCEYI